MSIRPTRRQFIQASTATAAGLAIGGTEMRADDKLPHNKLRTKLLDCLGGPWPDACDLKPTVIKREQKEGYSLHWVSYDVELGDRVPAILMVPDGVSATSPAPAVLICHQHNGEYHLGKSEPAGLAGNPEHFTGVSLVKEGYVVLCADALCFEERQDPENILAGMAYERFEFLSYTVAGQCMAWKNILDIRRAVNYLVSREEVDSQRIGCYGHSMGSTHTWLAGPWEPRIKAMVCNCCLPTYTAIHRTKILHCFPNFIPGFYQYGDTPDIAGLIAPRRLHMNFGDKDTGSPIQEVREGMKTIKAAYRAAGAEDQFSFYIEENAGHVLSPKMWEKTRTVFRKCFA